jgi:hypothetical protein
MREHVRMSIRQIPVGLDPSVSGLAGEVGERVVAADGSAIWDKTGAGVTDWEAPGTGSGTTDVATPSADGLMSAADKTKLDSLSQCATDPWGDFAAAFVAGKVPSLVNVAYREKFTSGMATAGGTDRGTVERAAVSGTGADATLDTAYNGGVMKLSTGTTGNSYRIARNTNSTNAAGTKTDLVSNCRTQAWAIVVRVMMDAPTSGCEYDICKLTDETTGDQIFGVKGSTSTANWAMKIGSAAWVDLGVALPTAGTWVTVGIIADGTNVRAWDLDAGTAIGAAQPQSTAITAAGHPAWLATNSAATNKNVRFDDAVVITPMAA